MNKPQKYPLEAQTLLAIVNREGPYQLGTVNADTLLELIHQHELAPRVFNALKKNNDRLTERIAAGLQHEYLNSFFLNTRFWNEFLNITDELRSGNIAFVPIKGVDMLARFYPEQDARSMADIDMLIEEKYFHQTQEALLRMGYQKKLYCLKEEYWRQKQCHVAFAKGDFLVEVHWGLDFKRGNTVLLPRLWKRVKEITLNDRAIKILSAEDAFFAFGLHLRRFGNILSLKQVLDAARIINESPGFDWEYVLEESRAGNARATLYFFLTQLKSFTAARIPEGFCGKLGLPRRHERLIEKFIGAHTFQPCPSLKNNYLKAHFLLYDDLQDPVRYLLQIPYEQFCKFYALQPYIPLTDFYYRLRLLYMPLKQILR